MGKHIVKDGPGLFRQVLSGNAEQLLSVHLLVMFS